MTDDSEEQLILKVLREHAGEALDVNFIAKATGLSWFKAYRILSEILFSEIIEKFPDVARNLSIVPEMTTKGLIFRSQTVEEVA